MPTASRRRHSLCLVLAAFLLAGLTGCADEPATDGQTTDQQATDGPNPAVELVVRSPAFEAGASIPERFTCDGDEVSPPLTWAQVPQGTAELALLVTDPDAPDGEFVHWVVTGLDPASGGLEEGQLPQGAVEGNNDFGDRDYGGPCPPGDDAAHRYVFTLYASGQPLDVGPGVTPDDVRAALQGKALARGQLVGTYNR